MQRKKKGVFISFEGIDGCGKTTQIINLESYLRQHNIPLIRTREPGGTSLGEALRKLLKYPEETYAALNEHYRGKQDFVLINIDQMRTAEPEILLFLAARAELVNYVIEPNLKAGVSVLADRFADSTRAYQGGGWYRSNPKAINFINTTHNFIIRNHWPDKTFLLKIPYEVSKKRLYEMSSGKDDFEKRERKFIEAIIKEYDNIAKENPQRVVVIDATKSKEEVFNQILQHVNLLYGFKK